MSNISKVIYGGKVLIDLTADTVTPEKLLTGYTAHAADGAQINGACDFDANTQDATAADSEILLGKTAYVKGTKKTGTMPNNGGVSGEIDTVAEEYTIPKGYHDGSGKVQLTSTTARWLNTDGSHLYYTNAAGKTTDGVPYGDTVFRLSLDDALNGAEPEIIAVRDVTGVFLHDGAPVYSDAG